MGDVHDDDPSRASAQNRACKQYPQASGVLARTDLAFSRDQPARIYVQHLIHRAERTVQEWVAEGAAIHVCGSAAGMSLAVEQALSAALGRKLFEQLIAERRFRRDVY